MYIQYTYKYECIHMNINIHINNIYMFVYICWMWGIQFVNLSILNICGSKYEDSYHTSVWIRIIFWYIYIYVYIYIYISVHLSSFVFMFCCVLFSCVLVCVHVLFVFWRNSCYLLYITSSTSTSTSLQLKSQHEPALHEPAMRRNCCYGHFWKMRMPICKDLKCNTKLASSLFNLAPSLFNLAPHLFNLWCSRTLVYHTSINRSAALALARAWPWTPYLWRCPSLSTSASR